MRENRRASIIVVSVTCSSLNTEKKESFYIDVYYSDKKIENVSKNSILVMCESPNTTGKNTRCLSSQLSFYEYPPHKPFINSTYQPLRPSDNLSITASLPESNRDSLLTSLQSLSLKIKNLETEREVSHNIVSLSLNYAYLKYFSKLSGIYKKSRMVLIDQEVAVEVHNQILMSNFDRLKKISVVSKININELLEY